MKDNTINAEVTNLSLLHGKINNTNLITSANLQKHTNPTISSVQETISASGAKQNESISQNIPPEKNIPFDEQNTLTTVQVENTKQSQNSISTSNLKFVLLIHWCFCTISMYINMFMKSVP